MRNYLILLTALFFAATPCLAAKKAPPTASHKPTLPNLSQTNSLPSTGEIDKEPQNPTPGDAGKSYNGEKGTDERPLVVKVISPLNSNQKTTESSGKQDDKSSADWWLVKLTGGLIGVGLLQALVFWVQAGRLKETIKKMDEIAAAQAADMKNSIDQFTRTAIAAEKTAKAAEDNVSTITDTSKRQLRAYVGIFKIEFSGWQIGQNISCTFKIKNFGETPAYNVRHWSRIDIMQYPYPGTPDHREDDGTHPCFTLHPKDDINGFNIFEKDGIKFIINKEIFDSFSDGRIAAYIIGRIEYDDAYGGHHTTKFVSYGGGVSKIWNGQAIIYRDGNYSD
jgi:hypothetical protein